MRPRTGTFVPLSYGAGLATGLLRFGVPACAIALIVVWLLRRRPGAALCAGAIAVGALAGQLMRSAEAGRCAARLPAGQLAIELRAIDPATGRGMARVRPLEAECTGTVDARWPVGSPVEAGLTARVTARWVPRAGSGGRAGGVLAIVSVQPGASDPTAAERVRNRIVRSAERLYGARASLVEALVLGTRGGLDPEMRDRFAYAGLVHLLSISGFHVGLLSAWIVLIARLLGAPRSRAFLLGGLGGVIYVAFLGWPAPGTRAAALAVVLAIMFRRQRRVEPAALLAETCLLVLLIAPWSVFDLGGWLSAAALWGATTATRWSDVAFGEGFLARTLSSSVGATLATAPITAAMLGAVALAGIPLNLIAIPIAAVAVPGVAASLLLAPVADGAAGALAAGSGLALHALELLAAFGAAIPGGHVVVAEGPRSALPWLVLLAAAIWSVGQRNTRGEAGRRLLVLSAAGAWVFLAAGLGALSRVSVPDAGTGLTLHFLDVGQGDGAAIRTPGGRWVVIDAGPRSATWDAGRRVVTPFLARQGARRIAAVVISHAHLDHLGGAEAVLDRFPVGLVLEPADQISDAAYTSFLDVLAADAVRWQPARSGAEFTLDGVRFRVLHPDTTWAEWGADVNEGSAVLRVDFGAFSALFAGDAGFSAEAHLAGRVGRVDLLKVGHHGSRGSSSDRWLAELRPAAALVSVGRNTYGHPAPDALRRLITHGADVWRTDLEGTVSVTTDGRTMTMRGRRGAITYPVQ